MTIFTTEQLYSKQLELEKRGKTLGVIRYESRTDKAIKRGRSDETSFGASFIGHNVVKLEQALKLATTAKKGYRVPAALTLLEGIALDVVAVVTLSGALRASFSNESITNAAYSIAKQIFHEKIKASLNKEGKQHLKNLLAKTGAQGHSAIKTLNYVASEHQTEVAQWPQEKLISLGRILIEITLQQTGAFEIVFGERLGKEKRPDTITASDKLSQQIQQHGQQISVLSPVYLPMVVKPVPWSVNNIYHGCYLTNEQAPVTFIKRNNHKQMKLLGQQNPEKVFAAVNLAQSTGWKIRKPVLSLLKQIMANKLDLGLPISSMPPLNDLAIDPDAPSYVQREYKEKNVEFANLRNLVEVNLNIAEEFSQFECFYVPHQVDTRGRIYPITSISPQGADYIKGLLEFSIGKPLGKDGSYWLKVHVANLFGIDKVPFQQRIKWVDDNIDALLASARAPLENLFWTTADKPIQAYAGCLELLGFSIEGEQYVSAMPIALDGSCSGLQHLGAAFNCEVTAKAVNLLDSDKPNDIYQDVADKVQKALEQECDTERRGLASQWLAFCKGRVDRNITKRPVMTFPYGSKAPGFSQQLLKDTLKPALQKEPDTFPWKIRRYIEDREQNRTEVEKFELTKLEAEQQGLKLIVVDESQLAAQYLAKIIETAVAATVLKAASAMNWMQKAASTIAIKGEPIIWTTPMGFPVVQDYRKVKSRQIDSIYLGKRLRSRYNQETDDIDIRKMTNAIAPNIVHSLDSAHLMLTVVKAAQEKIDQFALIHDSFATHAADTQRFFSIIREAFLEQYQVDVFKQLESEFITQVDQELAKAKRKKIPNLPAKGTYQVADILNSSFAFA